ncbi:MAG: sugar phosphate isomerase/epimerase [Clostridia bacterium]|nr:sugar phosphate isomerase/epimerase [Clostridia bacterium]
MKTSVSSYSFSHMMRTQGETQLSVMAKAKEYGFDAIEFTDLTPPEGTTQAEYALQLRAEADRLGLEISGYSIGADMLAGCNGDPDAEVARVKTQVDIAALLRVPVMRHDASSGKFLEPRQHRGFIDVVDRIADGCRQITEYAETKGIRTTVENHGYFCQDSDRVELLVNTVAHPNFGLQVDMGNFLCVDENPVTAVSRCAPYAFNAHAKDFLFKSGQEDQPEGFFQTRGGNYIRGTVVGHGIVPVKQCVAALKRAGYDGYLTLEFEGVERVDFALAAGAKYLSKLCK